MAAEDDRDEPTATTDAERPSASGDPVDVDRLVLVGVVVVAVVALLYSVLLTGGLATWVGVAFPLVALYLFWRLVRAHERVADALE